MLVEELKTLAANLYKNAEEAIPIMGDGDKNKWMAHRLDEIIEEDGAALNCLLRFTLISEVIDYLEKEYDQRKEENAQVVLPCSESIRETENEIKHPTLNDGAGRDNVIKATGFVEEPVIVEEEILIITDTDPQTDRNFRDR